MNIKSKILGLLSALGVVVAPAYAEPATEQPKIVSDAKASADWMAKALNSSGYKADFSLASFAELDRFVEEQAPNGTPRPNGLLSEGLGSRLFGLGSYVGETLIRQLGGEWRGDDNDPEAEINITVILADGSQVWPIQRVMKRVKNGTEDSLVAYGVALSKSTE